MTKPINHNRDLVTLACEQLRAQYPSASGAVVLAAARAANFHAVGNVIPFPRGWEFAETLADHGKGEF
jgi:hypothetical protein